MKAVIIGSGNVASNLARALQAKCEITQIYSPTLNHAQRLAKEIGCADATNSVEAIKKDCDVYIIAVKDDAIKEVIDAIPDNGALWVHTSGSKPIGLFAYHRKRYGALYPMQSFSRAITVDFSEVPIFIEGSDATATRYIEKVARLLGGKIYEIDSEKRRQLHIAAVLSCNFANHLWTLAAEVLKDADLPFDTMLPLIKTTVEKLSHLTPAKSQTGPAVREDYEVMNSHLSALSGTKHEIYRLMSQSIIETKKEGRK